MRIIAANSYQHNSMMSDANHDYTPPKVWTWEKGSGGKFANINRPVAGPTHEAQPVFDWETAPASVRAIPHAGQPQRFDFQWFPTTQDH